MDDNALQRVIVFLNALTKKAVLCGVLYQGSRKEKASLVSIL